MKHLALLATLVVASCSAGHVRLQSEYARSTYDYSNFALYHAERDTRVVIHGNPFDMDRAAFGQAEDG